MFTRRIGFINSIIYVRIDIVGMKLTYSHLFGANKQYENCNDLSTNRLLYTLSTESTGDRIRWPTTLMVHN